MLSRVEWISCLKLRFCRCNVEPVVYSATLFLPVSSILTSLLLQLRLKAPVFFTVCILQVLNTVTVRAVEAKFKTRFMWKSSRTSGTTPAFSKCPLYELVTPVSGPCTPRFVCWVKALLSRRGEGGQFALTWTQLFWAFSALGQYAGCFLCGCT